MTRQWRRQTSQDRDGVRRPDAPSEMRSAQVNWTRSVPTAVAQRIIRLTRRHVAPAVACILLIAAVGLVAGGLLWSDRLSPWILAILAPSTSGCPTTDGCLEQSPDRQLPSSGGAAVPAPTEAAPFAGPTPVPPTVFIDPGHGGVDLGAVGIAMDGSYVFEKDVALAIALRAADQLRAAGINVVLSRTDDSLPGTTPSDYTDDGEMLTDAGLNAELQSRVERANASGAQVLLSIHFNGLDDPYAAGMATIYCESRPFADKNRHFATLIQDTVVAALRAKGYTTPDLGVIDDEDILGEGEHLAILGPAVPGKPNESNMPGALFEVFYLSNPPEASAAMEPDTQDLIATALARAIERYLQDEGQQIPPVATKEPR